MVKTETYGADKNILIAPELAFTIPCIVTNTGVTEENGKKIIKAGTPVGGSTNVLENRQTALTIETNAESSSNAQGVVLHDVDVTDGNANATLVVAGVVDLLKLDASVEIKDAQKTKLSRIIFMKGAK